MRSMVSPLQRWLWQNPTRRAYRLLRFAEVEADGGRDLVRASELTPDSRLRRLYARHARDERRHAEIFHRRGIELLGSTRRPAVMPWQAEWLVPGERGLDDVEVDGQSDERLLAFLHLSEKAAARQFAIYRDAVGADLATRNVFEKVLRDEEFHMNYTRQELARISPDRQHALLWRSRLGRIWKAYLRFAVALAGMIGAIILTLQYYILLPPFAWIAKRAAKRETVGWNAIAPERNGRVGGEY